LGLVLNGAAEQECQRQGCEEPEERKWVVWTWWWRAWGVGKGRAQIWLVLLWSQWQR
jgi:hypothetical protein